MGNQIKICRTCRAKPKTYRRKAKEEFDQMIQSLQMQKEAARERLDTLGTSAIEGWEILKDGAEEALNELQNPYDQVVAKFR